MNNLMSYWIVGKRPVYEAIKSKNVNIQKICLLENQNKQLIEIKNLKYNGIIEIVKKDFFLKISTTDSPNQGVSALIKSLDDHNDKNKLINLLKQDEHVCLDGVTDTRNIGSIIRSCVAFGIKSLIINKRYFSEKNQTIIKSSSGAIFHIKINTVSNISTAIKFLKDKGYYCYIINKSKNSSKISQIQFSKKSIYIFGSEGKGISSNIIKKADYEINLETSSLMEHINVSNAVSAFLSLKNFIKK